MAIRFSVTARREKVENLKNRAYLQPRGCRGHPFADGGKTGGAEK